MTQEEKRSTKKKTAKKKVVKKATKTKAQLALKQLWEDLVITKDFRQKEQITMAQGKIENRQVYYQNASKSLLEQEKVSVPWKVIAIIHYMECNCDMKKQILNGERWGLVTKLVPKGLGPFKNFEQSCIEALKKVKHKDWSIEGTLDFLERWNGLGYRRKNENSPYLWSFTNHYKKGKYVADGKYDPEAVSKQVGSAILLAKLDYK